MKDLYKILGVKSTTSFNGIKKAFRDLAKKLHPDRSNDPNSEERFKEVIEAYSVISDPQQKAAYDAYFMAGSLSQEPLFTKNRCPHCNGLNHTINKCDLCYGVGHWVEKVKYVKYDVDSKIVCTRCKGIGRIITECLNCN